MFALLFASAIVAASPAGASLTEASHAIDVGRFDEARGMIAQMVAVGVAGPALDRLLADLAFASGHDEEALVRYQALSARDPGDGFAAERAGIAALKSGKLAIAEPLLAKATSAATASWRAWNAKGVAADLASDWGQADACYARAAALAPGEPIVLNNQGWSQLLRGEWAGAVTLLEQAAARDPGATRIADNLELARAGLAQDLPQRAAGEDDHAWAARLNDAGVAAQLRGDPAKAVAAFARAIEARTLWYPRAANNLQMAQAPR
jgi:Flp pilus assembly protein TadD